MVLFHSTSFYNVQKRLLALEELPQYFPIILSSTQSYPNSTIAEVANLQGNAALLLHWTPLVSS